MKFNVSANMTYRNVFIVLALLVGFFMPFVSFDYGITEDTKFHNDHGKRILNYFKGIDESASYSPIDEQGNYINISDGKESLVKGMNGFGGFFDFVSNLLYQYFPSVGKYEFNNMINAIFGFLLFLFCGLLGKELGDWKTGLLAFLFVVFTPVLFGHSMNNPKDIPAAAFYMFSLFHIVKLIKELPMVTIKRAFFLIVNISLLTNIRLIGLMFFGYVVLAVFCWWIFENYTSNFKNVIPKKVIILILKIFGICVIAYLGISVFWPYAHNNPITTPVKLLFKVANFKGFESIQLFEGKWRSSFEMPWYYALKSLFIIQMPLHVFLGIIMIPILYFSKKKEEKLYYSIVLFTSVFPLFLILFGEVNSYSNSRQFLFTVPPIIVLSAISCLKLFELITNRRIKLIVCSVIFLLMLEPVKFMIVNHPLQSSYYSPLVGGVEGAYGKYEIDYWGFAVKPAINWLENNVDDKFSDNPARVRMYYGAQSKVSYYLDKIPQLQYVLANRNSKKWDYSIIMLTEGKYRRDIDVNWGKENTVHEVKVDGVPICFIVKNDYKIDNEIATLEKDLIHNPSINGYIRLSLLYSNKFENIKSINASNKAISLDPNSSIAYNNLCSSYNRLGMYDKAKEACEKSLEINKSNTLTRNNLNESIKGIERIKKKELTIKEYNNLGYYYYKFGFYDRSIEVSKDLLKIDPKNVMAYNNICASYNQLQKWVLGAKACNEALEIDPDFQLAKNNLKWAEKSLKNP